MKIALTQAGRGYAIQSYGPHRIRIDNRDWERSLWMIPDEFLEPWPLGAIDRLDAAAFTRMAELKPDLVLLGTGERQRFPALDAMRPLVEAGIGLEVMDTGAACRTSNIVAGEGRRVLVILLLE